MFIYLLVTNQTFMQYVAGAVHASNTISGNLPVSSGDVSQLLNATNAMNESQFLDWAKKGAGVADPVISKLASVTGSATFNASLNQVWSEIELFKNGGTLSKITSAINKLINTSAS